MLLRKLDAQTLCDNGACGKQAVFAIEKEGTPCCMELHLCEDCVRGLQALFTKHLFPEKGKPKLQ